MTANQPVITILEPYENVDKEFFDIFGTFPHAEIPKDGESLYDFRAKVEDLLNIAEMSEVQVLVKSSIFEHFNRIIKNIAEFDFAVEEFNALDATNNTESYLHSNLWAISTDPFSPAVGANPYDNADGPVIPTWYTAMGGDIENDGELELPKSHFNEKALMGSELRIVDRLSKYGESFPFLNESGELSEAARQDFEELLNEATDEELLAFLKGGLDLAKDVARTAKDGVKSTWEGVKKTAKGAEKVYKWATKGKREAEEQAKKEAEETKAKEEKDAEQAKKNDAIDAGKDAVTRLDNVNADAVAEEAKAKKPGDATEEYNAAKAQANNAVAKAQKAGVESTVTDVKDAKTNAAEKVQAAKKELEGGSGNNGGE